MSNELIIDASPNEIVLALLEDKRLVELSREKANSKFSVGDIYLGKVKRIMTGLNATFVDVGYERDAFLHYLDLGPQFRSLTDYVNLCINNPYNLPNMQDFELRPEIQKSGKISELLASGQHILVQVAKEPISTKGPRLTSEISIAGRNLVLIPFSDKISVSQKIKSKEERERLRRLIQSIKPNNFGVIIRTVAKNRRVAQLDAELKSLVEKWETATNELFKVTPPSLVLGELNRASALLRDILSTEFNSIVLSDNLIYREIKEYIGDISPEQLKIVKLYTGEQTIFEHFGIDKQIKALFGKTVTMRNGAYLILEHTEALHVIDVNSGNRSKETDQEANALEVNLMAAEEIARQLRLRDLGGIIVIDFIDLHNGDNKRKVFEKMKDAMSSDRTKHNILPLSKFGLMQITRQRVRPEMIVSNIETCPTCSGSGEITPSILVIDEIEEDIKYLSKNTPGKVLILKVHPFIGAYITRGMYSLKLKWFFKYNRWIKVKINSSANLIDYFFYTPGGELINY